MMKRTRLGSILILSLTGFVLTACEKAPTPATAKPPVERKYAEATVIQGAVSNNAGIVKSGMLAVTDENGQAITQAAIDNGHFSVEIPANTQLPILLSFQSEPGAEKLVAVVLYETVYSYYVNPTSTAIAKAAKSFGGYTRANLDRAAENTVHVPDANKTSAGWRGDPTTQYGGWH